MLNTEILPVSQSASSRNLPAASTFASCTGEPPLRLGPLSKGEPGAGVSAPDDWLTSSAATVASGANANLVVAASTRAYTPPSANGEPGTVVSAPVPFTV